MHHAARPAAWQRCLTFALPARPSFSSCPLFYFYYRKINTSTSKYFPSLLLLLLFLIFKPNGKRENCKKKKLSEPIEFCRALVPKVLHLIEINIDNWNESNINKSLDFFSGWGRKSCFNCRCGLMQNVFLARTLVTKILTANSVIKKLWHPWGDFNAPAANTMSAKRNYCSKLVIFLPFFTHKTKRGRKRKGEVEWNCAWIPCRAFDLNGRFFLPPKFCEGRERKKGRKLEEFACHFHTKE